MIMSNWSLSNTYGMIFVRTAAGRQVIGNKWFFGKNFSFLRWCQSYWRTPIAPFHRQPEPRLLVYLAYMLMAGGAAFAGLRLFELSQGSFVSLQFQGMYAWHTAVNFGLCFIVLDLALDGVCCWYLRPRTVALTWLTGCCSYLIGFALQRTVVYRAIAGYYPDLLLMYEKFPIIRPRATHMFFYCLPFWLLAFCLTVWMIERLQHRFARAATPCKQSATAPCPPDTLQVTTDRGMVFLPLHAITHISMTDYGFEILSNVTQDYLTKWSIIYDISNLRVSFRSLTNQQTRHVDLKSFDFSCAVPEKILDINAALSGDVTTSFSDYSKEMNQNVVNNLEYVYPPFLLKALSEYPDSTICRE